MLRRWICEGCNGPHRVQSGIWDCPGCGKECCDSCFSVYAHCKPCCEGKSDEEMRLAANAKGHDFEPLEAP